ncbi:MAG TPA: HAD family phosphatase [Pararhizobium sp.]|nr:HAD family phosphatase [Pararhizobium sp.]
MTEIRHIVFDIGKVLVHYDPHIPYSRLIPDAAERRWFFENVCTHEWNIEQDRGRGWQEAEAELVALYPAHEANIRAFRTHWHEMVSHSYDDTVVILRRLIGEGRDVTMLTNFAADTFQEARKRFAFLNEARGVTVSGEVGLIKPDTAIYERHARDFDLTPSAILFIDDSPANVEGARRAGWHAVQFVDAARLDVDLARLGLSPR